MRFHDISTADLVKCMKYYLRYVGKELIYWGFQKTFFFIFLLFTVIGYEFKIVFTN